MTLEEKYQPLIHDALRDHDPERVKALLDEVGTKMEKEEANADSDS